MEERTVYLTLAILTICVAVFTYISSSSDFKSYTENGNETIFIERNISDSVLKYYPEEDEVIYTDNQMERPTVKHWMIVQAGVEGREELDKIISRRLRPFGKVGGASVGMSGEYNNRTLVVDHITTENRDGEVVSQPNVEFSELKEVAPDYVKAKVYLYGRNRTAIMPVKVEKSVWRNQ